MLVLSKNPVWLWRCPTKRAHDLWEAARFTSIFLASGFFCSQAFSQPAHKQVTQTVRLAINITGRAIKKATNGVSSASVSHRYNAIRPLRSNDVATGEWRYGLGLSGGCSS